MFRSAYGCDDRSEVTSTLRKTADGMQVPTLAATYAYDGIGNGNITAWTKSTNNEPVSRREYDAFGNRMVSEGTAPCSFGLGFHVITESPLAGRSREASTTST